MSAIAASPGRRPAWRGLIGFNLFTGILLAIVGWLIGDWIGNRFNQPSIAYFSAEAGQNDISVLLGYLFGVVGFLVGLGFANYPVRRMLGHPPTLAEHESEGEGAGRYFRLCTDHKVVSIQYIVGIGVFFLIGGINDRAAAAQCPRVRGQPVPDPRRDARRDDDGDDDVGHSRPVR